MELAPTRQAQRLEPPIALTALTEQVRAAAHASHDHADIRLRETELQEDGAWRYNGEAGCLSRHALGQLCGRLELPGGGTAPASYLARCPVPLARENLNHWLAHSRRSEQVVLVRTRSAEAAGEAPLVRAVLSDRYAAVDHLQLLESLPELVSQHGLGLQAWSLDDEQLTLRLTVPGEHPASLKDPIRVGLHLSNSEVGLGRISITALLTRLVCMNGLVVKVADLGGLHRRHIGRAGESLAETVQAGMSRVFQEADEAARRFVRLREQPAPQPLEAFLERTVRDGDLPEGLALQVTPLLEGETLYDVVNGFTRAAQQFPVAERLRIETTMSQFLRDGRNWS